MLHGKQLKISRKSVVLMVSLLVLFCSFIGGTAAYLVTNSQSVTNTFTPSWVTTAVTGNYEIKNTGNTDAWIRAAVVVTWQDTSGNVYAQQPNFSVTGTDWVKGSDGFYYYTKVVPHTVNNQTMPLNIVLDNAAGTVPSNYTLTVEILGSGIQTFQDAKTWIDAWGKVTGYAVSEVTP